ncbi:class II aldolase/adducin family protein, partial [Actinomadura formosensis]
MRRRLRRRPPRPTPAAAIVHTHSTYGAVVATTMSELPPIHYNTL